MEDHNYDTEERIFLKILEESVCPFRAFSVKRLLCVSCPDCDSALYRRLRVNVCFDSGERLAVADIVCRSFECCFNLRFSKIAHDDDDPENLHDVSREAMAILLRKLGKINDDKELIYKSVKSAE